MKKNILVISASPRKDGNSDILCDEFARGAAEAGHAVEKIRLAKRTSATAWAAMPAGSSASASRRTTRTKSSRR